MIGLILKINIMSRQKYYEDENGDTHFMEISVDGFSMVDMIVDKPNMIKPVQCNHCLQIYDLADAKINHRYEDCDQFTTPCCGYEFADTRTYKSLPDYTEINIPTK